MLYKLFGQIKNHKFAAGAIFLIIVGIGYWGYTKIFSGDDAVRYMSAQVEKGTLIVSITGSGQVSAANQVDIKPKASGEITALYIKLGQEVDAGTVLAAIDARDVEQSVRDAATGLETAKLELDKLLEPLDELTLLQAENSLIQAKESRQESEYNLKKAYEDGFTNISNAFLELPDIVIGIQDILYGTNLSAGMQSNISYYADTVKSYDGNVLKYKDDAAVAYQKARTAYDKNFINYKSASRFSDRETIEVLLAETYNTAKDAAEAVKSASNLIQFYKDKFAERGLKPAVLADTHLATLSTYTGKTNNHLSGLLSIQRTIQDSKDAIISSGRSIEEKELSLEKIKKGPDELDIRAKKIAIQQKEDALTTAKQALADHYVRAPFAGVIAKVSAKKGDSASAGTIIATLITRSRIAEISLNEVDVSKVKVGQKVTITFDAIEGLSMTGEVAEVESIGTVTQGVVNYGVKIGFDTQDERIRPGMSVSAAIITDVKQNVLLVPNSAVHPVRSQTPQASADLQADRTSNGVKQQNNTAYVEIFAGDDQAPRQQIVQTGLSNDTMIEITSGLNDGDQIVTQTITGTAQTQTTQSIGFRIPGITGGGGGGGGGGIRR